MDFNPRIEPEAKKRYEAEVEEMLKRLDEQIQSTRDSERLTAEDFNVTINCTDAPAPKS